MTNNMLAVLLSLMVAWFLLVSVCSKVGLSNLFNSKAITKIYAVVPGEKVVLHLTYYDDGHKETLNCRVNDVNNHAVKIYEERSKTDFAEVVIREGFSEYRGSYWYKYTDKKGCDVTIHVDRFQDEDGKDVVVGRFIHD